MSKSFYIHKKKRHLDSHRSTVTTQTQIKHDKTTMQSSCHAGEAYLA